MDGGVADDVGRLCPLSFLSANVCGWESEGELTRREGSMRDGSILDEAD
jgi:hypothetical protein